MKNLIYAAILLGIATADVRAERWGLVATSKLEITTDKPSCGADRLVGERWVVGLDYPEQSRVLVNHTTWERVVEPVKGIVELHYQAEPDAYTSLHMLFATSDDPKCPLTLGYLTLQGRLPDGRDCLDAVVLVGAKLR